MPEDEEDHPTVAELDELQTYIGRKTDKVWLWTAINHHAPGILAIEVVLSGTTWVLAQAFMALGRPGTLTVMQGIGLGLTVPLMLLLIPTYGLEGAGLALLGSTSIRLVFVIVSFPLILKVRPPGLLMTRDDWYFLQQMFQFKRG